MNRKEFLRKGCGAGVGCLAVCCSPELLTGATDALQEKAAPPVSSPERKVEWSKQWLKRFMDNLDQVVDLETRGRLMHLNGSVCYQKSLEKKKAQRPEPLLTLDAFVSRWKENGWQEGGAWFVRFTQNPAGLKTADGFCLCPLAEDGPEDLSPTYCFCSEGYVKEMVKWATGEDVKVLNTGSVRKGQKNCTFRIERV